MAYKFAEADITAGSPEAINAMGFDAVLAFDPTTVEFASVGGQNPTLVAAAMAAIQETASLAAEHVAEAGHFASQVLAGRVEQATDLGIF